MRAVILSTIAALAASALAQSLPSCATSCVGNSLSTTGCASLDIACICKSASWISNLSCCVSKSCDAADQNGTIAYAQSICKPAGVTNLPTAAGCSGNSTSATASSTVAAASSISSASQVGTASSSTASTASTAGAVPHGEKLGLGVGIAAAAAGMLAIAL